jgi:hypothetical protein
LFVRSLDQYLAVPQAVQDLVEGSNIHVMMLAYRVLALPDARARALAAAGRQRGKLGSERRVRAWPRRRSKHIR